MDPAFLTPHLLSAILVGLALLLVGIAVVLAGRDSIARDLEARVLSTTRGLTPPGEAPLIGVRRLLRWIGQILSGTTRGDTRFCSERDILALEGMISGIGMNPTRVVPIVMGLRTLLAIAVPALAFACARLAGWPVAHQILGLCVGTFFGALGVGWVSRWVCRPYLAALRRGMPDALDLLAICLEAGMGLEAALRYVSNAMRPSHAAVSVALETLVDALLVLPDRREALRDFAGRAPVEGARRLATMLARSLQYGTLYGAPLSEVPRAIALDLRRERSAALEIKAARLPVLLLLSLIVFIVPAMLVVLAGPPLSRLTDTPPAMRTHHPMWSGR